MRALCLPVIGFGNWDQMGMRQRVQGLVMALLEAFPRAMKNVVAPAPQSPLSKATARTAVVSSTGTETDQEPDRDQDWDQERDRDRNQKALSPGQTHSLRASQKGNTRYVYVKSVMPTLPYRAFSPFGNIIDFSKDPPRNCSFVTYENMGSQWIKPR